MTEETVRVFTGEIFDIDATEAKIKKINQRASAKGLQGGYTYEIKTVEVTNDKGFPETAYYLVVEGTPPKANGWTLVAKVTWEGDKPVVDTVPGYDGPLVDRSTLDGRCDICGWERQRNYVIVCESATEGRKVVGGQCVKDLLGHDFSGTMWPVMRDIEDAENWGLSSWGMGGGRSRLRSVNVEQVVCASIAATRVWGWVPRSAETGFPTADYVEMEIIGKGWADEAKTDNYQYKAELEEAIETAYTDQTKATAVKVIEWAKSLPPTSEFNMNLAAVVEQEQVDDKRIGILAYAFTGWMRAQEREAAARAEAAEVVNAPLADTKVRVRDIPATVIGVQFIEGFYGTTTLVKFLTDSKYKVAWFASNTDIDQDWIGREVILTGTVKGAKEWNGIIETQLTRCSVTAK